ncbi:MAG: M24 family metallopeptidase [Ilumatobacteraceae bacterium]|nr:M24 family metallopeptidase [Ilumatobacteraceae bacterium]
MTDRSSGFTPIDHARRVATLRNRLPLRNGCDTLLLLDLVDVRWLTGFTGSNGWAVVSADGLVVGTDGRYRDRAIDETASSGATVIAETDRSRLHDRLIESMSAAARVALDPATTVHARWRLLASEIELEPTESLVAQLRQVKDGAELERIGAAAGAADAALAEVEPLLRATMDVPVTEADVRDELEYRMRRHGADDRSYDTIVASGPEHAARPHHEVGRRTIVEGDTVVIDVGALVEGYHSDMTRSYVIGEPSTEQREIYALIDAAQRAGVDAVGPGVPASVVDAACRDLFVDAGYGDWYLHGTGHGVGLVIHEHPFPSQASDEVLAVDNVVTVEPGLYRGGFGGMRIEDLVHVTAAGPRVLTHHPKQPFDG